MKTVILLWIGKIIKGKIKPPEYDPLVGLLLDVIV